MCYGGSLSREIFIHTQQVKKADFRANIERSARLILDEKQVKLVQSYNDLNNYHKTARVEYRSLDLAFKQSNMAKTEESRRREYIEHLLACEKLTREQADKNFAELLASMKTMAITFHTLAIEKSTLTEDENKAEATSSTVKWPVGSMIKAKGRAR